MNERFFNKMMLGLALVVVGVLFLLNQTGTIEFDLGWAFSNLWPLFIVYFGFKGLIWQRRWGGWGGSYIWNIFVILLGVYFLLNNFGIDGFTYDNMYKYAVPAVLIAIGLGMMLRVPGKRKRIEEQPRFDPHQPAPPSYIPPLPDDPAMTADPFGTGEQETAGAFSADPSAPKRNDYSSEAYGGKRGNKWSKEKYEQEWHDPAGWSGGQKPINHSSFIGDAHFGQEYWELRPMNVSHFIGDTVIDLTKAAVPYGETKINVSAFIGDVKLFVPSDMQVEFSVNTSAFLGDMRVLDRHEGGLFKSMHYQTPYYQEAEKKIKVNVSAFIGDVSVTRVG